MKFCAMPCLNLFVFLSLYFMRHTYGNPADKDTGKCVFDNYTPKHELKSFERIRPLIGKTYKSREGDSYEYTVGICADLGVSDAGAIQIDLQADKSTDGSNKPHNIGSLKNSHLMAGSDWAFLEYKDGETYGSHCTSEGKRTSILLSCDETIGDEEAEMIFVEEDRLKTHSCYYLFEMKHKALCPVYSRSSVLSIGSIIVIVFITVLAVYLLVGFAYQRFVLGSKGLEQIPNYEFWKDFGNLQADGCDLICRTKERRPTGFRGIGDEQLDTTEDIRDDNLLPM